MGAFTITVHGTGSHHNLGNSTDANRMAAAFVQVLQSAGHSVQSAEFVSGDDNVEALTEPLTYLQALDAKEAATTLANRPLVVDPQPEPESAPEAPEAPAAASEPEGGGSAA